MLLNILTKLLIDKQFVINSHEIFLYCDSKSFTAEHLKDLQNFNL